MIIFAFIQAFAQIPQSFKYQAVARDSTGSVIVNQSVTFRISILKGSTTGFAFYTETHAVNTNQFGLVNLEVGNGNTIFGVFANINWQDGSFFIQIEMDVNGGSNFQLMGTSQLLQVPYSLYSEVSGQIQLTDENGNSYNISVDTLGNLGTTLIYKWQACGDTLVDDRDGQKYTSVLIGTQCWMAENLNIGIRIDGANDQVNNSFYEKYCYNDLEINCDAYGGLYQWDEMMQYDDIEGVQGICPDEWHVPTDEEWKQLEGEVDSLYNYPDTVWDKTLFRGFNVGYNLKSISCWTEGGNGTNLFGFGAFPGGHIHINNIFFGVNSYSTFWTSTDTYSGDSGWFRRLICYEERVNRFYNPKIYGYSVRCLKD